MCGHGTIESLWENTEAVHLNVYLLYYSIETQNTLIEGKNMNEECIGYNLVFLTNLRGHNWMLLAHRP